MDMDLDQHCILCYQKPVNYVKTKGGFHKVCKTCRAVLEAAGLLEREEIVHVMSADPGVAVCVFPIGQTTCGYTAVNHFKAGGKPMDHEFTPLKGNVAITAIAQPEPVGLRSEEGR